MIKCKWCGEEISREEYEQSDWIVIFQPGSIIAHFCSWECLYDYLHRGEEDDERDFNSDSK